MNATLTLLTKYCDIWREAWARRKSMDAPRRLPHEAQFLPPALALQDTPIHPAPRITVWTLLIFAAFALIWACIGKIDIVATASGKIVPSGRSKVIQPSEVAVVKAIHVRDGQRVIAGDVLVELDASMTDADVHRVQSDLMAAETDGARARALLESIQNHRDPDSLSSLLPGADAEQLRAAQQWLRAQYLELQSQLEQSDAIVAQREAEIQTSQAWVKKLQESLPIARQLSADYKDLLGKNYVARHAYLEKEQTRLDQERELTIQQARVIELAAARDAAQRQRQGILAQARRAMLDLQHTSEQRAEGLKQDLKKAQQRDRLMRLTAPVDGTVQQLNIHTTGGVVTEAQPLMVIVPIDQPVEVEALLQNKDIGFVHMGQEVEIKVETFTFTKYGVVHGEVQNISQDAIEDEKLGLVYSTRIHLKDSSIRVGEHNITLTPGMAVRAEIKTDQRRIIDYFLSPLQQYAAESLVER
jgi:hemolysin D